MLPKFSKPVPLDYNRDGWMDFYIAAGGCYGEKDLYKNEGSSFGLIQIQKNYADYSSDLMSPVVVDFNHENRPSILYSTYYLYNTGDTLTFGDMDFLGIENEELPMIKGDYDGDGEDDLVFGGLLYHNVGEGHFQKMSDQQYDVSCFYDYDGDGDLDLIGNELYRNESDGVFTKMPNLTDDEDASGGDFADLNSDGLPDYVVGNNVWINSGNGLLERNTTSFGTHPYSTNGVDFNGDGVSDVLYGAYVGLWQPTSLVYENKISTLVLIDSISRSSGFLSLGCIDYDGNNHPDYLFFNDNKSVLFKNTCEMENTPPSVPTNLWADVVENNVVLHWDTVSDDHSRYGSITYNIMVGTTPDGYDIKSPLSDIETGKRYAYDRGNAGHAPLWKLNNLANGTYYWRVQAIDNSLTASLFSETGTFVVNGINFNPVMSSFSTSSVLNRDKFFSAQEIKDNYFDREGDTIQGIRVARFPNHGVLSLDNSMVELGQSISIDDVDRLCFRTSVFENDTVFVKVYNEYGVSADSVAICITVLLFGNTFEWHDASGDVAWGDYDNDGYLDFASTAGIYHNIGSEFEKLLDSVPYAENVLWADVNNDSKLDCLFDNYVLTNSGNGHFFWNDPLLEWWDRPSTAVGDLNNDNKVDYLAIGANVGIDNHWHPNAKLFYNFDNTLSNDSVCEYLQEVLGGVVAIADFNNDGKRDVIISGYTTDSIWTSLYKNNGDTLVNIPNNIIGFMAGSVALGDYDNDGDLDLLICGNENPAAGIFPNIYLYDNFGGYYVKHEGIPFAPLYLGEAIWYDYDNDGYLDVLLTGKRAGTRLYRNNNGAFFEEINHTGLPELSSSRLDVADYDGDGFEDVLISGTDRNGSPYTGVFSNGKGNGAPCTNPQNAAPTDLEATVQGSSVVLSWNDTTASTYNVYVKNADGFVVSPMADISTDYRKVTDYGNAGYANSYILRGLPEGTYQWSVQTVNRSRKGGLFAEEQEFTITCNDADTTIVYDTACYGFESEDGAYIESGIYYESYLGVAGCDSIIERHVTITHECTPIIHVRMDGNNASGYTWNLAFSDLQLALNKASEVNGQVWVAEGTYYGDGVSENAFIIPHGVQVYGGFVGNEPADFDLSLRDFSAHSTILDGQHVQRTVYLDWWGDDAALLDGFTIQNGYTQNYGGNLFGGEPRLQVNNCVFQGDGAIRNVNIRNSVILGNVLDRCSAYNCVIINGGFDVWVSLTNCILWGDNVYDIDEFWVTVNYSAIRGQEVGGEGNITLALSNNGNSSDSLYVRFVDPENGDFRLSYGSACINTGTPDISELDLPSLDLQGLPRVMDGRIDMGAYEYFPVPSYHTYDTICDGGSVTFHDEVYSTTGQYVYHTNPNVTQDTLYILHLQVYPNHIIYDTIRTCDNEWIYVGDVCFHDSLTGDYTMMLESSFGCDSLIYLHYEVNPSYWFDFYDTIPQGAEYSANGFYVSAAETQNANQIEKYQTYWTSAGCDSTYVLHLTLKEFPYVYVVQNGTGDGSSWADALGDLQAAMDLASSIQRDVWVAEGIYYGDGISENAFIVPNGVYVYGGFAGNEPADYDLSLRDFTAHPTILDGQHVQRTVYNDWWAILDGFTIQNGYCNDWGGNVYGGGGRGLQITNCIVQGGVSESRSGGLEYATIRNSIITNNTSRHASAFTQCYAYNCIIVNNETVGNGSTTWLSNIANCILWNNITQHPEYNFSVTYSAIEGQEIDGEGNITLAHSNNGISPDTFYVRFVDPENGDFRLSCSSACINAGTPDISELGLPQVDLQGNPRVMDGRIDMGTYEFDPSWYDVEYVVSASANDDEGGTVTGGGEYSCGQICTLAATPNEGYSFINWTLEGEEVSTEATYSFTVTEAGDYVANFEPSVYEVIVSANPAEGGTVTPCGSGIYENGIAITLTATANEGYTFLYWIANGALLSTNPTCTLTVAGNTNCVARFISDDATVQTTSFNNGWNWYSTFIEQDGIDGLEQLEENLGANGIQIKAQVGYVNYYEGTGWMGTFTSINNESSYKIKTTSPCVVLMLGEETTPSAHPITIGHGWNWIGYPVNSSMSITTALSGIMPIEGDQLKAQNGYASYYNSLGWVGTLNTINPGMGLLYKSNSNDNFMLVYPTGLKGEMLTKNITSENNHWVPDIYTYPDNMTVTAIVELDDKELQSENYELGAFANGECRGSVRLMYIEPIQRYMAFLTVVGEEVETLSFGLYDTTTGEEIYDAQERLNFSNNAIVGSVNEPYVVSFSGMTGIDEWGSQINVFPNPVARGENISIVLTDVEMLRAMSSVHVEIINALGVLVETRFIASSQTIAAPNTAGVYTLRITIEGKGTYYRKLVVR